MTVKPVGLFIKAIKVGGDIALYVDLNKIIKLNYL